MSSDLRRAAIALALTASIAIGCGSVGEAAIHVVDRQHPAAADANPGTEQAPWMTIQHAADASQPGDTVYVMEGTYEERVTLKNSGAEGARITLKAMPRRAVEMHGFVTGEANHVRIEGFRITSPNVHNGIEIAGRHVEIVDNHFTGVKAAVQGSYGNGTGETRDWSDSGDVLVAYNEAYRTQYGFIMTGDGWRIENNEVERLVMFDPSGQGDCDYTRAFGRNHVLRWNYFHGTDTKETGRAHVDGCQVFTAHNLTAHNVLMEQNAIFDFGQGFMGSSNVPGAVSDFTFRRNIMACGTPKYGGAWGVCSASIPNTVVENNTFSDLIWYAVGIVGDGVTGGVVRNNVCANVDTSIITAHGGNRQPTETAIERNLVHNAKPSPGTDDIVGEDPQFADRAARNFRLKPGSPAIDAGAGGLDIGALEYPNVYYVDPRHPGASDDFHGYPAAPFRTLAKACSVAAPGETIVLRGGVYREMLVPQNDGMTVRAMKGERAVLSGADLVTGWKREAHGWSAPLGAEPKRLLRDGEEWTDYAYDGAARRLTVSSGGDPRLHVFETVVRRQAVDLGGKANVTIEGLEAVSLLDGR